MTPALDAAARRLRAARESLNTAMEGARLAALKALDAGVSEVDVSRQLGVNRMTVRKWRGKL